MSSQNAKVAHIRCTWHVSFLQNNETEKKLPSFAQKFAKDIGNEIVLALIRRFSPRQKKVLTSLHTSPNETLLVAADDVIDVIWIVDVLRDRIVHISSTLNNNKHLLSATGSSLLRHFFKTASERKLALPQPADATSLQYLLSYWTCLYFFSNYAW